MSFEVPVYSLGVLPAGADLSAKQFYCGKINSSGQIVPCDTADERVDGIIQTKQSTTAGPAVLLQKVGVSKAIAGAAITKGDLLAVNASGKVITAPTKKILTATATLDFPSAATLVSADLTIAVPGAAVGDAVFVGPPAAPTAGIGYVAFVSATGVVTVRQLNASTGTIDSASATFRVTVVKALGFLVGKALETVSADLQVVAVDLSFLGQANI